MEKKFYTVYYSNVNVEGELRVSEKYVYYEFLYGYFVKEFKQESRYREKEVKGFWGTKTINEEYFVTVGSGELETYVEEIDGKYYDIITGTEAISEISEVPEIYRWKDVEKIGDEYYYGNKKLNKDLVESKKLKFCEKRGATIEQMYEFLKSLTDRDIELYHQRMMQALNNIDKVQKQRMSKVSQEANKRKEQEDYVRNFIENNGFGRNRTR